MPLLPAPAKLSHAKLSHAEKDTLIAALTARLDEVTRPPKTPGPDRPPRKSRPGVGRALHPHPDRAIDRRLTICPKCEAVFPDASQTPATGR